MPSYPKQVLQTCAGRGGQDKFDNLLIRMAVAQPRWKGLLRDGGKVVRGTGFRQPMEGHLICAGFFHIGEAVQFPRVA